MNYCMSEEQVFKVLRSFARTYIHEHSHLESVVLVHDDLMDVTVLHIMHDNNFPRHKATHTQWHFMIASSTVIRLMKRPTRRRNANTRSRGYEAAIIVSQKKTRQQSHHVQRIR
jgi:DNA-directed RNA polymerase specialized sigma24 family protein